MCCSQCNRFTSYAGEEAPEIEDARINREGELEIEVRIVKKCGECGEELKEAQFTLTSDCSAELAIARIAAECFGDVDVRVAADSTEAERKGITYYGAEVRYRLW